MDTDNREMVAAVAEALWREDYYRADTCSECHGHGCPYCEPHDGKLSDWPLDAEKIERMARAAITASQLSGVVGEREIVDEAAFLCARLRGLESELLDDAVAREFYGHVVPSLSRLESIIAALSDKTGGQS